MASQKHGARAQDANQTGRGAEAAVQTELRAAIATASLIGVFSLVLPQSDHALAASPPADPVADGAAAADTILPASAPASEASEAAPLSAPAVEVAPNVAVAAPEAAPAPAEEAFSRLSLDLQPPRFLAGQLGASNGFALHAPTQPRTRLSRLRSRAATIVPDWQAPVVRDLSLFVANDDEALSWSFSESSPNYGRVSYQEDRVEIGKLAAGVSVALDDMQLALAYVSREEPSQLGYTAHEDYAGLIWTFRR